MGEQRNRARPFARGAGALHSKLEGARVP